MLAYLSRYTHRVAISNRRLIALDERSVTFQVKDYRIEGPGRYTTMTLGIGEFIRRFLSRPPQGFPPHPPLRPVRQQQSHRNIEAVRKLLDLIPSTAEQTSGTDPGQPLAHPCPCCGGRMLIIETFEAGRQPPHQPATPVVVIRIDTS